MRNIARFVVDNHCHITTLYQPVEGERGEKGEVIPYDNSALTLYDMERYGVDMAVLLPSFLGTTNESQAKLVKKYPHKFRACCSDQTTRLNAHLGKKEWTFDAAIREVDDALATGNFVGIGEFSPGQNARREAGKPHPGFEQRADEFNQLCDLAVRYDVPLHFHEHIAFLPLPEEEWPWHWFDLLQKVANDNPKAKILLNHGYSGEEEHAGVEGMKKVYPIVASFDNIYMETGGWCEKNFEVAFESGVSAARLMWGHDYGNVPQYIYRKDIMNYNPTPRMVHPWDYRKTVSYFMRCDSDFPAVPTYQSDFYGWGLRTVDRVGDWLTQDEINLIMGGTAAKLYKLPVPYPRMFPEGRPDIFGDKWEESIPYLPGDQIQHPEDVVMSKKPFTPRKPM
jgi:Tat protein secretion system quality control protein TatD with DNase activity